MKLKAVALDYDGTIAHDGRIVAEVKAGIARAREQGLIVLIVTGRMLEDLRSVVGDLTFVDAVVAENGAVVAFPATGRSMALHDRPSPKFLDELRRRGVQFEVGEVVIEAEASTGPAALEAIRNHEQPLALHFNRSRMMILPQGISKATGLAVALDALRLSPHNVLAIGDAENDHELLRFVEIGVAVEWGSPALKSVADEILIGGGPAAVGPYIDHVVSESLGLRGLQIRRPRRKLLLGTTSEDESISLAVAGRNVLVTGDPRSGKSWVAGLLCEQLILHGYSVCVVDPEGDYSGLEVLPRVSILGGDDPPPQPHELLRLLRHPDRSIVLDLSQLTHREKLDYLREVLPQIDVVRRRTGLPHRLLIDEAHYFLHDVEMRKRLSVESGDCTVVTYQASNLHPDVVKSADVILISRDTDAEQVAMLAAATGRSDEAEEWNGILRDLAVGEVAMLPNAEEARGLLRRIRLVQRLTPHVRHRTKYIDVPIADHHAFIFSHSDGTAHVRTLKELTDIIGNSGTAIHEYLRRGDISKWIADIFGDRQLATTLQRLEADYQLHRNVDTNDAMIAAIRSRYDIV